VSEDLEEMRRLADSFAATIREQGRQVETGMRSMSTALDQAANRLAAVMGGAAVTAAPAAAATTGSAAIAPGGIVQVRVMNDRLPVFVVNPPPPPDRGGAGGIIGAIGSGIGGFIGGIVGGFVGGAASPFLLLADLIALMTGLPGILDRVQSILVQARRLSTELVTGIRGLIVLLFTELTAAGIFPVSRLIASLLFLIDRGITLVLMHVQPIILWVERVIETITTWLGQYIERIASFVTNLVNALATFLAAYVTYMIDSIIRPAVAEMVRDAIRSAVSALAGALFAVLNAAGEIMIAAVTYAASVAWRGLVQLLNYIPGVTIPVPAAPTAPNWGALARSGIAGGQMLGRDLAEVLFGPAPVRPAPAAGAPGSTAPGSPPRFRGPGFHAPELHLPDMPAPSPQLERLLETPPGTTAPATVAPPATTVNGGISVAIRSETVSMENAEETARVIAQHVMDELVRLNQADRFGRGLPTASVA
jgi:hypothetical protein